MQEHLTDWLNGGALEILLTKKAKKLEQDVAEGEVTAYWAGGVLRIDLKPKTTL